MDDNRIVSEDDVRELLSIIANEEIPEDIKNGNPDYLDKVVKRKAELDANAENDTFWDDFQRNNNEEEAKDVRVDSISEPAADKQPEESHNNITEINQGRKNNRRIWTSVISIAATFVFLIGGTLLTRGSLDDPNVHKPAATVEPGGTPGFDESDIVDTSDVKNPGQNQPDSFASFMQDMWKFICRVAPYIGGAAVIALIAGLLIAGKKKQQQ